MKFVKSISGSLFVVNSIIAVIRTITYFASYIKGCAPESIPWCFKWILNLPNM